MPFPLDLISLTHLRISAGHDDEDEGGVMSLPRPFRYASLLQYSPGRLDV